MENLARHPQSVVVVLGAVAAMIGLLAVTRPGAHSSAKAQATPVAVPAGAHHSIASVRRAFLGEGLSFRFRNRTADVTTLSPVPPPWLDDDLYVEVGAVVPAAAPAQGVYERRSGNVLVHYGGADDQMLARVR